jgi:hypothetical protein
MFKRTLTTIFIWTFVVWSVVTAIYAVKWIAEEMAKQEFFAFFAVYYFVIEVFPLFVIGLILIIVFELTVWAFLPDKE